MNTTTSFPSLQISSSLRRPRRKKSFLSKPTIKPLPLTPSNDQKLNLIIDIDTIKHKVSSSFKTTLNQYLHSGREALEDFKTLVTIDEYHNRVLISCKPSSLRFLGYSVMWGFVVFVVLRFVCVKFGFLRDYYHGGREGFLMKRDRSLGGREVVVGRRREDDKKKGFGVWGERNPVSPSKDVMRVKNDVEVYSRRNWGLAEDDLPKWWPDLSHLKSLGLVENNLEYQREADRLIQAIMDNRMCGKDITEDDILQFRRVCKASGAKVYIETTNARDSFYRASVDFVLNSCSSSSITQIDGEDARQFVAGFAHSIGLHSVHAARILSAAVAARTRSWFLQAWVMLATSLLTSLTAFEMQGRHADARKELSKICLIHNIFPPKESSPEMEMVAQGLEKHLRVEQRKLLLNLLMEVCRPPSKSAVEALGFAAKP